MRILAWMQAALVVAPLLGGCKKSTDSDASRPSGLPPLQAADPELGRLHAQTCATCHAQTGNPAPQSGDIATWAPRVAQGMDVLLDHTLKGYEGMPALGSCADCSEAEFIALIRFMALREGAEPSVNPGAEN